MGTVSNFRNTPKVTPVFIQEAHRPLQNRRQNTKDISFHSKAHVLLKKHKASSRSTRPIQGAQCKNEIIQDEGFKINPLVLVRPVYVISI